MQCTSLLNLFTMKTDGTILPGLCRKQMTGHDVETGCMRTILQVSDSRYREDCLKILSDFQVYLNSEEGQCPLANGLCKNNL